MEDKKPKKESKKLSKAAEKAINKIIEKTNKMEKPAKKPAKGYALYIKKHAGQSVVSGVDYKGKPRDKMKALGVKWKSLTKEQKDTYK